MTLEDESFEEPSCGSCTAAFCCARPTDIAVDDKFVKDNGFFKVIADLTSGKHSLLNHQITTDTKILSLGDKNFLVSSTPGFRIPCFAPYQDIDKLYLDQGFKNLNGLGSLMGVSEWMLVKESRTGIAFDYPEPQSDDILAASDTDATPTPTVSSEDVQPTDDHVVKETNSKPLRPRWPKTVLGVAVALAVLPNALGDGTVDDVSVSDIPQKPQVSEPTDVKVADYIKDQEPQSVPSQPDDAENSNPVAVPLTPVTDGSGNRFVTILEGIYFESGSANLVKGFQLLDELASSMKLGSCPHVELYGHTDTRGSESYNLILSQERATAVGNYLMNQGVSPSQISVFGRGEVEPIQGNNPDQNRRVEFVCQ